LHIPFFQVPKILRNTQNNRHKGGQTYPTRMTSSYEQPLRDRTRLAQNRSLTPFVVSLGRHQHVARLFRHHRALPQHLRDTPHVLVYTSARVVVDLDVSNTRRQRVVVRRSTRIHLLRRPPTRGYFRASLGSADLGD
jgi:hypothetical protein